MAKVLITGGAGFIGSHVADELLKSGYSVRALDNLSPQVHGPNPTRPDYLNKDVELIVGDIRDPRTVQRAVQGVDAVYHFAASVGVGQSMYEIADYTSTNNLGTAILLESLSKQRVDRLVVASSMSIYGEGAYRVEGKTRLNVSPRPLHQLKMGQWELMDQFGRELEPVPTGESKTVAPSSVYALSKYDQERLCMVVGEAYGIPTVALRFFNVYGPRQSLTNPYTGVLAIFAARMLNGHSPLIFEDGKQQRDFVHVGDLAKACRLALEVAEASGHVFNVGSGHRMTVRAVAQHMAEALGCENLEPEITHKYRVGDIRHCFADIKHACQVLGYSPRVELRDGMVDLAQWLAGCRTIDHSNAAREALVSRGLVV